jgi:twinkle protein
MRELYRPKFLSPPDWSTFEQDDAVARRSLLHAELLTEAVLAEMQGDIRVQGACMPWQKTWSLIRFRPGEVTLWAGYNGHKKSMVLGQVAVSLSAQRYRTVIASFEMAPHRTLARMVKQALKGGDSPALVREVCKVLRVWFYDQQGDVTAKQVYAAIRYAATLGVDHFVIDPMLKVVRGTDDYSAQKEFISQLCRLAREHDMHIHLVHHARKGADENEAPRKLDVRGAGEITDQVDNVAIVWWNKKKHDKRDMGAVVEASDPDALLIVDKQRNGAWEGSIKLWFDGKSLQFCEDQYYEPEDLLGWGGPKTGRAAMGLVAPIREPGADDEAAA